MKTYKVVFDGHIEAHDLAKMVSNEYGRSGAVIDTSDNSRGHTEAVIEFGDDVPYEVIELMTDGSVVVQQLVLENRPKEDKLKESAESEFFSIVEPLTSYITRSDEGEFLSATIYAYMTAKDLSFDDAVAQITRNMNNFREEAFNLYLGR